MPVGEAIVELILDLVRAYRPEDPTAPERVRENMRWGPGPRAAQALMLAVRARALLRGAYSPSAQDVADLAPAVLNHRMALGFGARARGITQLELIDEVTQMIVEKQAVS
jgi:MoxR-like ATPase